MKTYEQQAIDFLQKHGITFKAEFLNHGAMKWDKDGTTRDIYQLTLKRGNRILSVEFGQSIMASGKYQVVKHLRDKIITDELFNKYGSRYAFENPLKFEGSLIKGRDWYKNENYSTPTAYDMLAAITKYDPGEFEDFCHEFGYDTDSRNAYKTWKSTVNEWKDVQALFNDEELEQLRELSL